MDQSVPARTKPYKPPAAATWPADGRTIAVRPSVHAVDPGGTGVLAFQVTVDRGAAGVLHMEQDAPGMHSGAGGPVVVTGEGGWHFTQRAGGG